MLDGPLLTADRHHHSTTTMREFEIKSEPFKLGSEDFFVRFLHGSAFKKLYHERRSDVGVEVGKWKKSRSTRAVLERECAFHASMPTNPIIRRLFPQAGTPP